MPVLMWCVCLNVRPMLAWERVYFYCVFVFCVVCICVHIFAHCELVHACVQPQTQCVSNQLCVWVELTAAIWEGTSTSVYWTHTHTHTPPSRLHPSSTNTYTYLTSSHLLTHLFPAHTGIHLYYHTQGMNINYRRKRRGQVFMFFFTFFFNVSEYVDFIYLGINLHGYAHKMC